MKPRLIEPRDLVHWDGLNPIVTMFSSPEEIDAGVEPCAAVVTDDQIDGQFGRVARVPYVLDEIEVMHLAKGGTLWLSTWGGLPMHYLEVQEP